MEKKNQSSGILGAALVGAAAGAAAVYLSNKENRKKVTKTIQGIKKDGAKRIQQLQDAAEDITEKGRKRIAEQMNDAREKIEKKRA